MRDLVLSGFFDELEKISIATRPMTPPKPSSMPQTPQPQSKPKGSFLGALGTVGAAGLGIGAAGALLGRPARALRAMRNFKVTSPGAIPRSQSTAVNWWRGV